MCAIEKLRIFVAIKIKMKQSNLLNMCRQFLLLCLLIASPLHAADASLWLRVEQVDSLFRTGHLSEARTLAAELLPVAMEQQDALQEARLRLINGVCLRSEGREHEALKEFEAAATLVESPGFEKMNGRIQRHLASMTLAMLATNEQEMGLVDRSVQHARSSVQWAQKQNDRSLQAFIYPFMGHILAVGGHAEEALPILEQGKALAHQLNLPQYEKIADRDLAEMQQAVTQTHPSDEPTTYLPADDSAAEPLADSALAQARDTVVKQVLVDAHGQEEEKPWWQHRQVLYIGVALLLVLLMLGAAYILRQRRFRLRINQLKETSESRYLEGKEEERNRLAKEMHDGVSNQLLAIEMKLQSDGLTPQTMQMLSESREQVRRVSHELMPPDFEYATLDDILRNYVEELDGAKGCELTYRSEPDEADWASVPKSKALGIYRIVQEAVGNALKHSDATQISVVLQWTGGISVTVANDGMLMQPRGSGIGLRTMQQRADAIGGTITMQVSNGFCLFMLKVE